MADNWANWYSGNMAPPNRLPNGSYVPAPSVSQPMTVQQMYQGIYGTPQPGTELTTRSIRTVPIDPYTGRPIATAPTLTPTGGANSALGAIANATGTMTAAPVYQPSGSMSSYKSQDRLPMQPAGMQVAGGSLNVAPRGFPDVGYRATMRFASPAASLTSSAPLMPGPAYTPQPVSGDPWGGMRMPGQGTAPMAGYGNAPSAAQPAQQQARSLFASIFGGGSSAAPALYSPSAGAYMPTMAPGGKERRKDADRGSSSPTGSGGSLVGR